MRKQARGFSLIELLIVVAIILIVAAIAIPSMVRSRLAAHEASAVESIRTITTAEIAYVTTYPSIGYTCSMTELGPPAAGVPASATAAGLLDAVLATGIKRGYQFTLSNCGGNTPHSTYDSVAVPTTPGASGTRSFCSNDGGTIWQSSDGTAATCQAAHIALQ